MNVIDRIISAVSPETGLKRAKARQAMQDVQSRYDAVNGTRQARYRRHTETAPLGGTIQDITKLRALSRDLVRNDALARRGVDAVVNNTIGRGITPRVIDASGGEVKGYRDLVREHLLTTDIDAAGQLNIFGLQSLALRGVVEGGEFLLRRRPRRPGDGLRVPFQIEALEAEFIDSSVDGPLPNGNNAVRGVELDLLGRRVAYYLFDEHPNDTHGYVKSLRGSSRRVSADNICHIYRVDRPGQQRGVPWLSPVIQQLFEHKEFMEALLLRQKMAALYGPLITTPRSLDEMSDIEFENDSDGQGVMIMEPGVAQRLDIGEDVRFPDLPKADGVETYLNAAKRNVAAALGISYEVLSGDYSQVNYSSGRMGWIEMSRSIDFWRSTMLVPQMLSKIGRWFFEASEPVLSSSGYRMKWTAPRREMVDPTKDISAAVTAIEAGLTSRTRWTEEYGQDVEEIDSERAEDMQREESLGLRASAKGGNNGE